MANSSAKSRVLISLNPKAGATSAGDRVDRLVERLTRRGLHAEVLTDLGEVTRRVASAHAGGTLRAVVGVGGDGTVGELVNRTGPEVPITMLPAGTSNLVPKYLGMEESAEGVARTIAEGLVVRLDAGRANGRLFAMNFSCGFDADVVQRLHRRRAGHIRAYSYAWPILSAIGNYRYPEMEIQWDEAQRPAEPGATVSARWFFGFNLPCYAAWLPFAPAAVGDDGLLDACLFAKGSFWAGMRYLAAVACHRHTRLTDCTMRRFRRAKITSREEVPYQLDGDPGGLLPVEVELVPRRLTFVVPRESAARLGLTGTEMGP